MLFKRIAMLSFVAVTAGCATAATPLTDKPDQPKAEAVKPAVPAVRVKHKKDAEVVWVDPESSVMSVPAYEAAKLDVLDFWQCFSERDWENCYLLETPQLRKDMKLPFYIALWGNTAPIQTISIANLQFLSDSKLSVDVTYVFAPKPGGLPPTVPTLTLRQEWLKVEEDGGHWRRDYRDPVFRPAAPPAK